VAEGLALTDEECETLNARVLIRHEDSRAGDAFINLVEEQVERFRPDLLIIDPAFAYIGGDVNSGSDVGYFLRAGLNPILRRNQCAVIIVHHTNKPIRDKGRDGFQAGDFAYLGAGHAEWANWARAVVAITNIGSHEVYELVAGKRGKRLEWRDDEGHTLHSRHIGHAKGKGIFWREVSPEEVAELKNARRSEPGAKAKYSAADLLNHLPEPLSAMDWFRTVHANTGASRATFNRIKKELIDSGKVSKSDDGLHAVSESPEA